MSEDFYPFVDSGDPAPDNTHLSDRANTPVNSANETRGDSGREGGTYTTRISVYDDMLSTPRVIVVEQKDVRTYLEDVTNTVHRTMKEQGGHLSLMIIRELVENFIHAQFSEPVISILDDGDTIRFADQGPGINDKERAFEFGVTSADRSKKRYIRGTGAGLPMVQQYVEAAGGAISVEDNLGAGTVVTVSVNPGRVAEIERAVSRGAAVRSGHRGDPVADEPAGQWQTPTGWRDAPGYGMSPGMAAGAPGAEAGLPGQQAIGGMQQPQPMPTAAPEAGQMMPQAGTPGMPSAQGMQSGGYDPQATTQPFAGTMPPQPGMPGYPPYYQQANPWMSGMNGYPGYPNPYGMPQPYGAMPGYAQPMNAQSFQPGGPAAAGMGASMPPVPEAQVPTPYVSERGTLALRFIAQSGKGGPTDLTRAFGNSDATWSRELDTLAGTGLIYKRGQKYVLTELGQSWTQQH